MFVYAFVYMHAGNKSTFQSLIVDMLSAKTELQCVFDIILFILFIFGHCVVDVLCANRRTVYRDFNAEHTIESEGSQLNYAMAPHGRVTNASVRYR